MKFYQNLDMLDARGGIQLMDDLIMDSHRIVSTYQYCAKTTYLTICSYFSLFVLCTFLHS